MVNDPFRRQGSWHHQRGQMLPLLAIGIFAVMGMTALSVDLGYWRYQQRLEQSAADSAAVAGAIRLNYPTAASSDSPTVVAQAVASSPPFGYTDDGTNNNVVAVSTNPPTPTRASATPYPANTAVEVIIRRKQPTFFARLLGSTQPTVSARAVAVAAVDTSSCLYQLQTGANSGFLTFKGSKPFDLRKCGVKANGPIDDGGGFSSTTTTVEHYDTINHIPSPPTVTTVLPRAVTDPCFKIISCRYLSGKEPFAASPVAPLDASLGVVTNPNIVNPYANPVYVTNCCASATTFSPGIYYVYQGSASQMGPIYGSGVTIVNVDGNLYEGGLGTGASTISAPTSGPTAGVAYYHPFYATNQGCTLNGGGNNTSVFDGIFYSPASQCTINGGSITFSYVVIGSLRDNGGGSGSGIIVDPTLSVVTPNNVGLPTHVIIDQ